MSFYDNFKNTFQKAIFFFFRVEVINADKEPISGALVCSNHLSNIDPIIICAAMKKQVCFMAKKELFRIPLLSGLLKKLGAFPINRGAVDMSSMKTAIKLLDENKFVGLFPQGTRYASIAPRLTEVKSGAGMLLSRSKADVLPVAIITKNNKFKLSRKVYVVLGDVIKYEDLGYSDKTREEFNRVSAYIFEKICDLHEQYSYLVKDNLNEKQ